MLKTMEIGGKEVTFSTAFAWAFIYKSQFGEDPIKMLMPTVKSVFADPEIAGIEDEGERGEAQAMAFMEELGITGVAQIAWAMAKLVDNNIPSPLPWIESFGDDFPVMDMLTELITDAISSCFASKKAEAPIPAEPTTGKVTK